MTAVVMRRAQLQRFEVVIQFQQDVDININKLNAGTSARANPTHNRGQNKTLGRGWQFKFDPDLHANR